MLQLTFRNIKIKIG